MTSQQIGTWLAFDDLEPIGRDWQRTRQLINWTADLKRPLQPEEFQPSDDHPPPED